jgi:hypothetical protein
MPFIAGVKARASLCGVGADWHSVLSIGAGRAEKTADISCSNSVKWAVQSPSTPWNKSLSLHNSKTGIFGAHPFVAGPRSPGLGAQNTKLRDKKL